MDIRTTKLACFLLVLFAIVSHGCAPAAGIFPASGSAQSKEKGVRIAGVPHLDLDELDEVGFVVTAKDVTVKTWIRAYCRRGNLRCRAGLGF